MTKKKQDKAFDRNPTIRREDVEHLRKFTGKYFTKENGYDFRKPLSKSRKKTFNKYIEKLRVLTGNGYVVVKPKVGEKRILVDYAGQTGFPKFSGVIVRTPKANIKMTIDVDKTRPRGEQVRLTYPSLKQSEVKISREYILYFVHNELKEEFSEYVRQIAPDATVFIVNSEGGSMWQRTAGDAEALADIVFELAEKYDTKKFSRSDYSHFDNWVESISCLTNEKMADAYINKRFKATREKRDEWFRQNPWAERFNLRWSSIAQGWYRTLDGEDYGFLSLAEAKATLRADKEIKRRSKAAVRIGGKQKGKVNAKGRNK